MRRVLVTGGAGFIGSHLVRELVARQCYVRVLDNVSSGDVANLEGVHRKIEFLDGDIRNAVACRNACRTMDTVFHLAAQVAVPQSVLDPVQSDAINSGGTLNLLLAARDNKINRFVFSSSCAVYGDTREIPTSESVLPAPASPYGLQKLTGEHYCRVFTRLYGLETVSLRYFNVYGPQQNIKSAYAAAIPIFLRKLLADKPPTLYGDGEQTRDFCYVKDVVAANLLAAETTNPQAIGSVYNIGSGNRLSLNKLLLQMQKTTKREIAALHTEERPGDIRHSGANISRAQEILGYAPKTKLADGLKQTAAYLAKLPHDED